MNKIILLIGIMVLACTAGRQNKQENISQDLFAIKFSLQPSSSFLPVPHNTLLEKIIHRPYLKNQAKALKNNQYLIENLMARGLGDSLVNKTELIKRKIFTRLSDVGHTAREDNFLLPSFILENGPRGVFSLSPRQLFRVYLVMEELKNKKFLIALGQMIENDLNDYDAIKYGILKSEHGGLVYLNPEVNFQDIRSVTALPFVLKDLFFAKFNTESDNSNNFYLLPEEPYRQNKFIAFFHIHAVADDNSKFAGPSFGARKNKKTGNIIFILDFGVVINEINLLGESHNFLITKLPGNNFNIDYYGGERIKFGQPKIIVLDLGNYSY